ncbi:hypothetical protein ACINWCA157_1958 [Acinetobacter radioresistens WC-A-157]|nr:hypothetical protein ACINWCA157_1958 [Acinetobacter radioresistens WC-A-157]
MRTYLNSSLNHTIKANLFENIGEKKMFCSRIIQMNDIL